MIDIYKIPSKKPPLISVNVNGQKGLTVLGKVMKPTDFEYFLFEDNSGGNRKFQYTSKLPNNRNYNNEPFKKVGNYIGTGPNMDHHCFSYIPVIDNKSLSPSFTGNPVALDKHQNDNIQGDQFILGIIVDPSDANLKYFESGKVDLYSDDSNLGIHNKVCDDIERAVPLKVNNINSTNNGVPISAGLDRPLTSVGKQYITQVLKMREYVHKSIQQNNNLQPAEFGGHQDTSLNSNLDICDINANDGNPMYETVSSLHNLNYTKSRKVINPDVVNKGGLGYSKNRYVKLTYDIPGVGRVKLERVPYSEVCVRSFTDLTGQPIKFHEVGTTNFIKNPIKIENIFIDFRKKIDINTNIKIIEANLITLKKDNNNINFYYIDDAHGNENEFKIVTLGQLLNKFYEKYNNRAFSPNELNNIKNNNFEVRTVYNGGHPLDIPVPLIPAHAPAPIAPHGPAPAPHGFIPHGFPHVFIPHGLAPHVFPHINLINALHGPHGFNVANLFNHIHNQGGIHFQH